MGASHPVYKKLQELPVLDTAHHTGSKQVFSTGRKDLTRITQVAFGRLLVGETIPAHAHPDMDECFYITVGKGEIKINGVSYVLEAGVYVEVPAGSLHELNCSESELGFFYFGLQVYSPTGY